MTYGYYNDSVKKRIEKEFPMSGEIPSHVTGDDGLVYDRIWNEQSINVPPEFHDSSPFAYGKKPNGSKRFF